MLMSAQFKGSHTPVEHYPTFHTIHTDYCNNMSSLSPASSEFSMSLASVNSSSSTTKKSVKLTQEYRALRQQFFHLQSTHSALKLLHEREMIAATSKRSQLQEEINGLKEQVDELKKDQIFILESEKEAIESCESLKAQNEQLKNNFTSQLKSLEAALEQERERKYFLEAELTKTKLSVETQRIEEPAEFSSLLNEWKTRVIDLTSRNSFLELEVEKLSEQQNTQKHQINYNNSEDPETLRQKILSTYVSLQSAQSHLQQKRTEAELLTQRIGNVKILEEKYRDALVRIKRLESAATAAAGNIEMMETSSQTPPLPSPQSSDLQLIQLSQDLGCLKESLALASLNYASLQADLDAAKTETIKSRNETEETKKTILKLQNTLKVKDSTITNLKEQLDSTVTLLTETLKKK